MFKILFLFLMCQTDLMQPQMAKFRRSSWMQPMIKKGQLWDLGKCCPLSVGPQVSVSGSDCVRSLTATFGGLQAGSQDALSTWCHLQGEGQPKVKLWKTGEDYGIQARLLKCLAPYQSTFSLKMELKA